MDSITKLDPTINSIELLDCTLEQSWASLCAAYDVDVCMPKIQEIFNQATLKTPPKAAETVLVNMLTEIIESIGRFSPWYKQPARSFGLISLRDPATGQARWLLAPEALKRWEKLLKNLVQAIKQNNGLIQATLLVENLVDVENSDDQLVIAQCECLPPRRIQLTSLVLERTAIICDECQQPFMGAPL